MTELITEVEAVDVRFPVSTDLDGSDALDLELPGARHPGDRYATAPVVRGGPSVSRGASLAERHLIRFCRDGARAVSGIMMLLLSENLIRPDSPAPNRQDPCCL